jgi:hypothetical protein
MLRFCDRFLKKTGSRKTINAVWVTIDVISSIRKNLCPLDNFLYIPISYSHLLKFNPVGKEIALLQCLGTKKLLEEERS